MTLWSMAGSNLLTPHPTLTQGPQKMTLDIPHKGVATRASPGNSCWGHGISRPWKQASSMNPRGLDLDRDTSGGLGQLDTCLKKTRLQRGRRNYVHFPVFLRVRSAPLMSQIMPRSWCDIISAGCHSDPWL